MKREKGQNNILVCSPSKKNRGQIYLVLVEELMNNYTTLFGIFIFLASERSLLYLPQPKRLSFLTIKSSMKFVHWLNFTLEKPV